MIKFIGNNGTIKYYLDDECSIPHREGGPALEYETGDKFWYINGKLHRIGGPAIIFSDGSQEYWEYGYLHRLNGSAIDYTNGYKEWHYKGKWIDCKTQKEFERYLKLLAFY